MLSRWLYWRTQSEENLARWGTWARIVRHARRPLAEFLACEEVAWQLDNYYVRAMLWPHRKVPDNGFIDRQHDRTLVRQAAARLKRLDFADVMENPRFLSNLEKWIGRHYPRFNETTPVPAEFKSALHDELTPLALGLLEARDAVGPRAMDDAGAAAPPDTDVEGLRERALIGNVARHPWLMIA